MIDTRAIANKIATELYNNLRDKLITKIGIDEVRSAIFSEVISYPEMPRLSELSQLETATLRAVIEKTMK